MDFKKNMKINFKKIFENLEKEDLNLMFSSSKNFEKNFIGELNRNKNGLHLSRILISKMMSNLRKLSNEKIDDCFEKNGFSIFPNFLEIEDFELLRNECRSAVEKDNCSNYVLNNDNLKYLSNCSKFLRSKNLLDVLNSCSSLNIKCLKLGDACKLKIQNLTRKENDIETVPHSDTFFDSYKYWYFMQDTNEENGAFKYLKGSNNLSLERIEKEYELSISYENFDDRTKQGSFRFPLERPESICVSQNTLIIANVFGIHCRGNISPHKERLSLHGEIRANPFELELNDVSNMKFI